METDYGQISEAIEECKRNIENSFDRFEDNLKELILGDLTNNQEELLEEYFVENVREVDGRGITKDNYEDMFDWWLQKLTLEEVFNILK